MSLDNKLNKLKGQLQEISDLKSAMYVLYWDQSTYMPPGGAVARGRQIATLNRLAHQQFTSKAIGKLLDELQPLETSLGFDSDDASLIRVTRRDYERALRLPSAFVMQVSEHSSSTYQLWAEARPANDFGKVTGALERGLDFSRKYADYFAPYEHVADPLIHEADEGMTVALLRPIFAELREALVALLKTVMLARDIDDSVLRRRYGIKKQLDFALKMAQLLGYDTQRGRQDLTLHPFAINFSVDDVRITTRAKVNDVGDALFSTLHEAGHAMYEQGISAHLEGTPLASGTSAGVHESQARLWENIVGRSRSFWDYAYPRLQKVFQQLQQVAAEDFYCAVNRVTPSLIRTDADELTYNLHVIIRFELELELLEGRLAVKDLPDAWRERYAKDLGVSSPTDTDGVLQDVHWYAGLIGGQFQGYTLGNILSSQFYESACQAHPEIPEAMRKGDFSALRNWLTANIYQHGRKFTAPELIPRATGQALTLEPYLAYLRTKYGGLYEL